MPIKHAFASAKADGGDATLVQPSNWNADHTIDTITAVQDSATTTAFGSVFFNGVCSKPNYPVPFVVQNKSATADAGARFIALPDNISSVGGTGNPGKGCLMGVWGSVAPTNWTVTGAGSGYLYCANSDLALGTDTSGKEIVFHVGGLLAANEVARFMANGIRTPLTTSDPSTPASGFVTDATRSYGGYPTHMVMTPDAIPRVQGPLLGTVHWWAAQAIGNATTAITFTNQTAPTYVGTATARNWASTSMVTRARRIGYVSAATAGSLSSAYWAAAQVQYSLGVPGPPNTGGFLLVFRFAVSDAATVSGARMFVGMSSATTAPTNVEPTTLTNSVGLAAISTSSNLQIVYGGSAAQTAVDLGANFPANTLSADLYELVLYAPPESNNVVKYRVTRLNTGHIAEGTLTGTAGTALPANTTALTPRAWRCNNATALAVGIDYVSFYMHTENG